MDAKITLTKKQKEMLETMKLYGDLYTSYTCNSMRTLNALVSKGVAKVVSTSEHGKTFGLVTA